MAGGDKLCVALVFQRARQFLGFSGLDSLIVGLGIYVCGCSSKG